MRSGTSWAVALGPLLLAAAAGSGELRLGVALDRERVAVSVAAATVEGPGLGPAPLAVGRGTLLFWVRGGGPPSTVFRIQVAALADERRALDALRALPPELVPGAVTRAPAGGPFRVRGGAFATREEALARLADLAPRLAEAFVVEETGGAPGDAAEGAGSGARMKLALVEEDRVIDTPGPVLVRPLGGEAVGVDGIRYRGVVEVRLGSRGRLVAINQVDLEDYLRGVVPREMGPAQYPEIEALKAQAVAARTYALASRGGSSAEGYDLCATARCQVYGGIEAEHLTTDRAIAETRGLVLASGGALIKAYFSATCGGHTEDVERVFEGETSTPYLRGVVCAPPGAGFRLPAGRHPTVLRAEDGTPLAGPVAVLRLAGVLERDPADAWLRAEASPGEARALLARAARAAGRPPRQVAIRSPLTRGRLWRALIEAFSLEERARVLLFASDRTVLARARDSDRLDPGERQAAATLALLGALPVFADGSLRPGRPVSRGLLLAAVTDLLRGLDAAPFEDGVVVGLDGDMLAVRGAATDRRLQLAATATFLREAAGELVPYGGGVVLPGDWVRLGLRGGAVDLLVVREALSGGDDRRARDARWSTILARAEVEARLGESQGVGRVSDLRVLERGVSGRPLALQVIGSGGEATLRLYAIKRMLGLKDDLFVVERIDDPDGGARAFRFIGRGWGHGVGLCQEGAFGMALRGEGYRAILGRYFPGADLVAETSLGGSP